MCLTQPKMPAILQWSWSQTTAPTTNTITTSAIFETREEPYRWFSYVPLPVFVLVVCLIGCRMLHDRYMKHGCLRYRRQRVNRPQRLDVDCITSETTTTATASTDHVGRLLTGRLRCRQRCGIKLCFKLRLSSKRKITQRWHVN